MMCNKVCPLNTLRGCVKDDRNNGVCILTNDYAEKKTDEETVCHCNKKENAELIAKILDADSVGDVYDSNTKTCVQLNQQYENVKDWQPVVHGRWMPMKRYRSEYVCSECGDIWPDFKSNYCNNCGAKMDEDGDE